MREQVRAEVADAAGEPAAAPAWLIWFAWAWVALVAAAAIAEIFDLENLRLALDFQRHLR
ncbi:MAG: hypothetical protein ACYTG6_13225 [Planctomycetota bacterium]|jgi:hypothetical protein